MLVRLLALGRSAANQASLLRSSNELAILRFRTGRLSAALPQRDVIRGASTF